MSMQILKVMMILCGLIFSAMQAQACLGQVGDVRYCPGDLVVHNDGTTGVIVAVQLPTKRVAVRWTWTNLGNSIDKTSVVYIGELAISRICRQGLCPKDIVLDSRGNTGEVKAINPLTLSAAVRWTWTNLGYSIDKTSVVPLSELLVTKQCLDYGPEQRAMSNHL